MFTALRRASSRVSGVPSETIIRLFELIYSLSVACYDGKLPNIGDPPIVFVRRV
jgi:hypothetical protein